ncbi:RNA polymerase sigma factor [Candidatus Omnitrophota bacterium]
MSKIVEADMDMVTRDIVHAASQGDMIAFEQIYRSTVDFVYSVVYRVTGNQHDAEEVAQDVFLKVYKNLKRFQFRSSFKTWVYRIAVNTAINTYKKVSKDVRRRVDFESTLETQGVSGEAHNNIEHEDSQEKIQSLLTVLNPDQRTCILLREIEGKNYQEIADILRININTVRSRLKRARETLMAFSKKRGES